MTQEDKDLLLQELCARLPYGVIIHLVELNKDGELYCLNIPQEGLYARSIEHNNVTTLSPIEDIKPYLRPMSSMTKEEEKEFLYISKQNPGYLELIIQINSRYDIVLPIESFDWLNAHHFDYRGLIEKGLALEAPESIY